MASMRQNPIDGSILEGICKILGHTNDGLTGTEIPKFLAEVGVIDTDPGLTKWKRLYNALGNNQNKVNASNNILKFINKTMAPARFIGKGELHEHMRFELNKLLSFVGLQLMASGKFLPTTLTTTIFEAEQKANRFKSKLEQRNTHPKIFEYCKAELLAQNYFHSVFEAVKSIAEEIRKKANLTLDGAELIDKALSVTNPLIKINSLQTETEQSEQKGFSNLIKGVFGMFRNTTAHTPKVIWEITEDEALDIMTIISLIHKKLNKNSH